MSKKSKPGDGSFMKGVKGAALYADHFTAPSDETTQTSATGSTGGGSVKQVVTRLRQIARS